MEIKGLMDWLTGLAADPPSAPAPKAAEPEDPPYIPALATSLWRAKRALPPSGGDIPEELRRVQRHIEAMWDIFAQAGVEIQDHTDAAFDSGMALKALVFQPTAGLQKDKVLETIKPSIYQGGHLVQMGEVIVGTPEENEAPDPQGGS